MNEYGLSTFSLLAAAGFMGALAVIPYSLSLASQGQAGSQAAQIPLLPQIIQGLLLALISTGIGMLAAKAVGLSVFSSWESIPKAVFLGIGVSALMIALEFLVFLPHLSAASGLSEGSLALWKRLLASLYGGITEELLMRLFLMSGILWLLKFVWHTPDGSPAQAAICFAIVLVAILFGLGHLPAAKLVTGLSPLMVTRVLVLNGIAGLVFGYLYWRHGLFAAMAAHFSADITLHVITPFFTR